MVRSRRNRNGHGGQAPPGGGQTDRLERVAVPFGDGRTLAFVRRTVLQVEESRLTLADADGRRSMLQVTADTAFGTRRLPTTRADVVPGVMVAAVIVEQLDDCQDLDCQDLDCQDLALRIVVIPPQPSWSLPPMSSA